MDVESSLYRLQSLQRDLVAFSESRLTNVARLSAELDASIDDFKRFLDKKRKNEASRNELVPTTTPKPETLKIEDVEYKINDDFRLAAIIVADMLDLDELQAAKLCIDTSVGDAGQPDGALPQRAVLRYHDRRQALLECVRLILQQYNDAVKAAENSVKAVFAEALDMLLTGPNTAQSIRYNASDLWTRSVEALAEIEDALRRVSDRRTHVIMTGQSMQGGEGEVLQAQHILLHRQHESLLAVLVYLLQSNMSLEEVDFRNLISKAAALEDSLDVAVHYLPALAAASVRFGAGDNTPPDTSHSLHKLFEVGPAQQQWRMAGLKAAAVVVWLAEYSHRFEDPTASREISVANRQKAEQARSDLLMQAVRDKAFHFMLAACKWLQPEVWHDPAKLGLVDYLLSDFQTVAADAPQPSSAFAMVTMRELQRSTDMLVTNMPDIVRRLKAEEDDQRRLKFSLPATEPNRYEPDLERFIVIMSYAYQDDPDGAEDFWLDKEDNLHGFLRWVSQRLPTPRVAAFCELLTSISSDQKTASYAHRFLLEDAAMVSGKLRKTYSISWSQIFAELDTYASSLRDRPTAQAATAQGVLPGNEYVEGVETSIMLEAYLRLAAHICCTSPEARNWLLREQTFHLGDVMFQLASSGIEGRIQASCFNMLSALLTDKVPEVNDGMWVMLDNWIAAGGPAGSNVARPVAPGRTTTSEKHYLQRFNAKPETATAFVALLNALVTPSSLQAEPTLDALPFPENLGAPNRHAGIEAYVDFAVGTVFRHSLDHVGMVEDETELHVLRFTCLEFMYQALATFNEDLVLLANTTNIAVDAAIKVSSLATYARLHPFARVMEWLFNNHVITALFATSQQNVDDLNHLDFGSPHVQAMLRSVQVMNLAMKLQATYFDIVRPIVKTQSRTRSQPVANAALASFDEVMLSQLAVAVDITSFAASQHPELSLEALSLLQKLGASRKISDFGNPAHARARIGNRLVGALADSSDAIAMELVPYFQVEDFEIESGEQPLKVVKAQAVLDMLNSSLNASLSRPTVAHCLLGFSCGDRAVKIAPGSAYTQASSLFHAIATCSAQLPVAVSPSNLSWLLSVKRGCLDVINTLAVSPLTANLVRPELLSMDLLDAVSSSQIPATVYPLWDTRVSTDPETLLSTSAAAVRDFLKTRELFFQYAALHLRIAAQQRAYSVQEFAMSTLRGSIRFSAGEQEATMSIFDLFDFADLETAPAMEVTPSLLRGLDMSVCVKDDPETMAAYDLQMAKELLILRKRELIHAGKIRDENEEQQLDDEINATLASLMSHNNFRSIQTARLNALEAWTELLSLMLTSGGLAQADLTALALQGLQTILPKFERSLSDNLESAALLAKLTLTLVQPATMALGEPAQQNASTAHERLLSAFRVCLKTITDSSTSLGLRDVCYRICCAVIKAMPLKGASGATFPSPHAKQLLQLVHHTGDRLLTISTEDAFSGRGSTRVSAILFIDALMALSQAARVSNTMLKALSKLNFVPVLIDSSIGSIASSFQAQNEELVTALAYFHTVLALMLRICTTADGTQLVLNSGFFSAINDSRLFSTDPDIGLDIDNPAALVEFYKLLSAVLRVITVIVVSRGSSNSTTVQQAKNFLQQNRFSMQAVFKRTGNVQKTAGPPEKEALNVADEFGKLMLVTGFLEEDESAHQRTSRLNGFT